MIRHFGSKDVVERLENVLKTIPQKPDDPNLTVEDCGYKFDEKGVLRHAITGSFSISHYSTQKNRGKIYVGESMYN
jgi:hypothetical protein